MEASISLSARWRWRNKKKGEDGTTSRSNSRHSKVGSRPAERLCPGPDPVLLPASASHQKLKKPLFNPCSCIRRVQLAQKGRPREERRSKGRGG